MEDRGMPRARNARVQDRRTNARINTLLPCTFEWSGVTHEAELLEVSLIGALMHCRSIPPAGTDVVLSLKVPETGREVAIPARVIRGGWYGDRGEVSRFAVRFKSGKSEALRLVALLSSGRDPLSAAASTT